MARRDPTRPSIDPMTTEQRDERDRPSDGDVARQPSWWHRDHPTFSALTGFFTGLAVVILVPGLFVAALGVVVGQRRAESLFPLVLVTLVVPIVLSIIPRTRRFGLFMAIGMVTTALVVGGVATLVLWYMVTYQS
jgi:hypothetical protein